MQRARDGKICSGSLVVLVLARGKEHNGTVVRDTVQHGYCGPDGAMDILRWLAGVGTYSLLSKDVMNLYNPNGNDAPPDDGIINKCERHP